VLTINIMDISLIPEPDRRKSYQVLITEGHPLYKQFSAKTFYGVKKQIKYNSYKAWLNSQVSQKGRILYEVYKLYDIYQKYKCLELYCEDYQGKAIKDYLELSLLENCYGTEYHT